MSHWGERWALFQNQPFRLYALACLILMLGNGMGYIALTWMVLRLDSHVSSVVIVMFCFWLPSVFIGPFAGAIADRYRRKALYLIVNGGRGLVVVACGVYEILHPSLHLLYVLSLLQGIAFAFILPVLMALIREIVNKDKLLMANATIDIAYEIGNVSGMACAGVAIAWLGMSGALVLDGVMFLLAMLIACRMELPYAQSMPARSLSPVGVLRDMQAGYRYMMAKRALLLIYSIQLLVMVAFMTVPIIVAPFAMKILKLNVKQFGVIEASMSAGMIIGGLIVPWLAEKVGLMPLMMVLLSMMAVAFAVFGYVRHAIYADCLNVVVGFALSVWPLTMTRAQELTDLKFQGRVQSTFNCLSGVLILIVYCLVDTGSHFMTIPDLYWIEVLFSLLALLLVFCGRGLLKA